MQLLNLDYTKNKLKIWLVFICLLMFSLLIVFLPFLLRGNYLLWGIHCKDGAAQHASFLYYLKNNGFIKNLDGYDFFIGLGNDYLLSYVYYMIFDPFNIFLIIPINNFPLMYSLLIILKFIASGIFMFLYLKSKNIKPVINMLSSVFYMLSGFLIFTFVRHPDLAAGAVYLPLIILGLEKVMKGKRPYILIISAFLCLASSFYMFFMCSLFYVFYAIVYYFELNNGFCFKKFIISMLKPALYYLIAILLAAFFLIPVVFMYGTIARSVSKGFVLYTLENYAGIFLSSLSHIVGANYTSLGINIIIIALFVLFLKLKLNKSYKIISLTLIIGLILPITGYVFNLFNYVNNRWVFLLDFVFAVTTAMALNYFSENKFTEKLRKFLTDVIIRYLLIFSLPFVIFLSFRTYIMEHISLTLAIIISVLYTIFTIFALLKSLKIKFTFKLKIKFNNFLVVFYSVIIILALGFNIGYSAQFKSWNYFNNQMTDVQKYISSLNKTEFFRTDKYNYKGFFDTYNNEPVVNEYYGTNNYNTMSNGLVYEFFTENAVYNTTANLGISGLNQRKALSSLLSVKYYINNNYIPYNFTKTDNFDNLYKNEDYLELGIVYTNTVSKDYYDSLPTLEKQSLLLEALVLENGGDYNYQNKISDIQFLMVPDGVEIKNNTIYAEKGSSLTFMLDGTLNKEIYLSINNFKPDMDNFYYNLISTGYIGKIKIQTNGESFTQYLHSYGNQMYTGQKDFTFNTGYCESDTTEFKLIFENEGVYTFDNFKVSGYDMNDFNSQISQISENHLENVSVTADKISGNITVENDCYLFLSLPYSEGFSAFINHSPVEIYKADTAFMALKLKKGENNIVLTYKTPYFNSAIYISLVAAFILISLIVLDIIMVIRKRCKAKVLDSKDN